MNQSIKKRALAGALSLALAGMSFPTELANSLRALAAQSKQIDLMTFSEQTAALARNDRSDTFFETIMLKVGSACAVTDKGASIRLSNTVKKVDNVLLVPADFLAQKIGAAVQKPAADGRTAITGGGLELGLQVGSASIAATDKNIHAGTEVQLQNDVVMVPLEEVAKELGYNVTMTENGAELRHEFQTARLIVKASGSIPTYGAKQTVEGFNDLHILQYESPAQAYAAYLTYLDASDVEFVEPSVYVSTESITEKEKYENKLLLQQKASTTYQPMNINNETKHYSWGADTLGVDTYQAFLKEQKDELPEICVAVVDTGIDYQHPWFEGRIADGGKNFSLSADSKGQDDHGHGTHVSGTICDLSCDNVKILPVKVLNSAGGGYTESIYCGMMYANEQNVDVVNMSLGVPMYDYLFGEAIEEGTKNGTIYCVAAGNEATNAEYASPASISEAITVSSINNMDLISYFSNYGEGIDFAAPGEDIVSAQLSGDVVKMSGTSMASPHVAACCALLRSYDPDFTPAQVQNILKAHAVDLGEQGYDKFYGYGAVNMDFSDIYEEVCKKPVFEPTDSEDAMQTTVSIVADADAAIYYTTDGSIPSPENGTLYAQPLVLEKTTRLRAIACAEGKGPSAVATQSFIIGNEDLPDAYTVADGVLQKYNGVLDNVRVPARIDGVAITAVAEDAFRDNVDIGQVILPETVTALGDYAFSGCPNLMTVQAPGVTTIGNYTFANSEELYDITLGTLTQAGVYAFSDTSVHEMDVSKLKTIPDGLFSGCVGLFAVLCTDATEIGDYAFAETMINGSLGIDFTKVTRIGSMAFYECPFSDTLELPGLKELAPHAFANSWVTAVSLPASITAIPEGCFLLAHGLNQLSAPGVTKIAAYGLAISTFNEEFECDIHWDKVTDIDAHALEGIVFFEDINLSSLKTLSPFGLHYTIGTSLTLPGITEVPTNGINYALFDVISLPNAVTLKSAAIDFCGAVLLGDCCTEIADDAMKNIIIAICGTKGSTACAYATAHDIPFMEPPCILNTTDDMTYLSQYEYNPIAVLAIGTDLTYQWYQTTTGAVEDGTPLQGATERTLLPDTAKAGTFYYFCQVTDTASQTVLTTGRYIIEVAEIQPKEITTDTPVDLNAMDSPCSEALVFVPEHDGQYCLELFAANETGVSVTLTEQETGKQLDFMEANTLKAGNHYIFTVENDLAEQVIRVVLHDGSYEEIQEKLTINDAVVTEGGAYPYTGEAIEPALPITLYEQELVPDVDYDTVYYNNIECGTGYQFCFGKGNYNGAFRIPFQIQEPITLNETKEVTLRETGSGNFLFVPEKTGRYNFSCIPTQDCFDNKEDFYSYGFIQTMDGEVVSTLVDENEGTRCFLITARLNEGEAYLICPNIAFGAPKQCSIRLTDSSVQLIRAATTTLSFDETALIYNGSPLRPSSIVVTRNDQVLTENKDYIVLMRNNTLPGMAELCICGIGDYCGSIMTLDLPITFDSFTEIDHELKAGELFVDQLSVDQPTVYHFRPDQDDLYSLDLGILDNFTLQIYKKGIDGNIQPLGNQAFTTEISNAKVGEEYYYVISRQTPTPYTNTVLLSAVLNTDNTDITISNCTYTGEEIKPEVTVTHNGKTLVKDEDYELMPLSDMTQLGTQEIGLIGTGRYTGEIIASFSVILPVAKDTVPAVLGKNQVTITEAGTAQTFRFVPDKSRDYAIATDQTLPHAFYISDETGAQLFHSQAAAGNSGNENTYYMEKGKTYFISMAYLATDVTGSWSFTLRGDFKLLRQLDISYPNTVAWTGQKVILPVTIKDGDYELEEGKDYYYHLAASDVHCGPSEVLLSGMGRYYGSLELKYNIVQALPEVLASTPLMLDAYTNCAGLTNHNSVVFSFTAEEGGFYGTYLDTNDIHIDLFDADKNFIRSLAPSLDSEGNSLLQWSVEPYETVYLQLTRAENMYDIYSDFTLNVQMQQSFDTFFLEDPFSEYDMIYTFQTGAGTLCNYTGDYTPSITVPEVFNELLVTQLGSYLYHATQKKNTEIILHDHLKLIDSHAIVCDTIKQIRIPYGCELMPLSIGYDENDKPVEGFTIYGYLGDYAQAYAEENNFRFVPLNPAVEDWEVLPDESTGYALGDVNNDSAVNVTDAVLILKDYAQTILGAQSALTKPQQAAADINADGKCDLNDAILVLKAYAQSILTGSVDWDTVRK